MSAVAVAAPPEYAPTPPQNLDAEESILGACLVGGPSVFFSTIEAGVRGEDFYRDSHRRIFEAIAKLAGEGVPTDAITVIDQLEKTPAPDGDESKNMLDVVGGRPRLHELAALVPATANAPHYAAIVREQALKRAMLRASIEARDEVFAGVPFEEALDTFDRKIEKVRERSVARRNVHTGLDLATRFHEKRLNPPSEDEDGFPQPRTYMSKPLKKASLYTVAGYTGDGKTVVGLDFLGTGCHAGQRVGYASLEMTGDEIVERLVSKFSVPYDQAQTGRIEPRYAAAAEKAEKTIAGWNFDVLDDEEVDPAKLRRWAVAGKYDLVVVDHLHRIEFEDRFQIEKTVRGIRNMAKRLDIPVVMLAQLNRTSDKKNPYPPPTLQSLRETAVIEHESAYVGFIWRERDPDDPNEALPASRWICAKHRFGDKRQDSRSLFFRGEYQKFTPVQGR